MAQIRLKKGREKSLKRLHPWIFSGAIESVEGQAQPGETVDIIDSHGRLIAFGAWSPISQIRVRVWTFDVHHDVDQALFRKLLQRAIAGRKSLLEAPDQEARRLVNAESDGLPGIIVDQYGEFLSCQFLSTGGEFWKEVIVSLLRELVPCKGIYERSDSDARTKEGLESSTGVLWGEEPPLLMPIQEGPCRYLIDIKNGHKTGYYLDQRESRAEVARLSAGKDVLNCFAYTGGFGLAALQAGARSVTNIEASGAALEVAHRNVELNELDANRAEQIEGDVFKVLRKFRDEGRLFDLIVLDPPKFAESKGQIEKACRGYKDINLLACKLLRPEGLLFTFSCSGLMTADLFQKIVSDGALDAGRRGQILKRLGQAQDHPTALEFPEGTYLKGLVCRIA